MYIVGNYTWSLYKFNFIFPGLDGTPLPPPPAQRSRVLDNCLKLCMLYIYISIVVPVHGGQPGPPLVKHPSVDLWEIDRLPRMHIVADRSSEKDNVRASKPCMPT